MQQEGCINECAENSWYKLESKCVYCNTDDFTSEYGPRHFLLCSCCNNLGTHVECFEKHTNRPLTKEFIDSGSSWFCCKGCEEISSFFASNNGMRMPVRGESAEYSLEVVQYDPSNRGARNLVDTAVRIFRDAFGRMMMPNGRDYIEMCCTAYESPDNEIGSDSEDESTAVDFTGFRVVALRKGSQIVTVATLRLFGTHLAEMPYVATRTGFRRAGHCRRLLKGVEDMLRKLHVSWLVLPSVKSILTMWRYSFNFMPLTLEELSSLEAHIISPDFGTVQLLKKRMWPPPKAQRGRPPGSAAAAVAGQRDVASRGRGRARGRGGRGRGGSSTGVLQFKFGSGTRRRRSANAARSGADGDSEADSDGAEDQSDDGESSQQDEESKGAAEERAAAEAAWALFEMEKQQRGQQSSSSSSSSEDESSSSDDESDGPARKRGKAQGRPKKTKKGKKSGKDDDDDDYQGAASSSSDNDSNSDTGLVSEDDDFQHIKNHKQQHRPSTVSATASGSTGAPAACVAAAADSSDLPTQADRDVALQQLRREVKKAGGQLPDGWTVRLNGRSAAGKWLRKYFIAPGTGEVFSGPLAVKRHLGLAPPAPRTGTNPGPTAALTAAMQDGPNAKRQRTTGPAAGGTMEAAAAAGAMLPAADAGRKQEIHMGRLRRQHMSDATIGVGLAESVRIFYSSEATKILTAGGSHTANTELQLQLDDLYTERDNSRSTAAAAIAEAQESSSQLAAVQQQCTTLQAERDYYKRRLADKEAVNKEQDVLIHSLTQQTELHTKPLAAAAAALVLSTSPTPAGTAAAAAAVLSAAAPAELLQAPADADAAPEDSAAVVACLMQLLADKNAEIELLKHQLAAMQAPAASAVIPATAEAAAEHTLAAVEPELHVPSAAAVPLSAAVTGISAVHVSPHKQRAGTAAAATEPGSADEQLHELMEADSYAYDEPCLQIPDACEGGGTGSCLVDSNACQQQQKQQQEPHNTEQQQRLEGDCIAPHVGMVAMQVDAEAVAVAAADALVDKPVSAMPAATAIPAPAAALQEPAAGPVLARAAAAAVQLEVAVKPPPRSSSNGSSSSTPTKASDTACLSTAGSSPAAGTAVAAVAAAATPDCADVAAGTINANMHPALIQDAAAAAESSTVTAAVALHGSSPKAVTHPLGEAITTTDHFNTKPTLAALAAAHALVTASHMPAPAQLPTGDATKAVVASSSAKPLPTALAAGGAATAQAAGSGGSRLSDSFLSGLLPDVVGCLMYSPAVKLVDYEKQDRQERQLQEQQQNSSGAQHQHMFKAVLCSLQATTKAPSPFAATEAETASVQHQAGMLSSDHVMCLHGSSVHMDAAAVPETLTAATQAIDADSPADGHILAEMIMQQAPAQHQQEPATGRASTQSPKCTGSSSMQSRHVAESTYHEQDENTPPTAHETAAVLPAAAVSTAVKQDGAHILESSSGSGTQKKRALGNAQAAQVNIASAAAAKRHKHCQVSSSSKPRRRASSAVLDLFGDAALFDGLHSPGSTSSSGGRDQSSGSRSGSDSGSCSLQGPGSGSSSVASGNKQPGEDETAAAAGAFAADTQAVEVLDREHTPSPSASEDAASGQQQHTPSSDAGTSGLSNGLEDMFKHVTADMVRDGMLPCDDAVCKDSTNTHSALAAGVPASGTSRLSKVMAAVLGCAVPSASKLSVAASKLAVSGAARKEADTVGNATAGETADLSHMTRSVSVGMTAGEGLIAAGSAPIEGEETFAAALDTAALFAFAGDIE